MFPWLKLVILFRPGDTILIEQEGGPYIVDSVVIDKPLFLVCLKNNLSVENNNNYLFQLGSGLSQDDTVLSSPRGSEGYLFNTESTCGFPYLFS